MNLLKIDMLGSCKQLPVTSGATSGKRTVSTSNYINIFAGSTEVKFNPNMYIYNLSLYVGERFNFRNFRKVAKMDNKRRPEVDGRHPVIFRQLYEEFSWN